MSSATYPGILYYCTHLLIKGSFTPSVFFLLTIAFPCNKWVAQDSMEMFTLCDCDITNSCVSHYKPKNKNKSQLQSEKIVQCERVLKCLKQLGYGMTETSPATSLFPREWIGKKPGSVGVPIPNSEMQVSNLINTPLQDKPTKCHQRDHYA